MQCSPWGHKKVGHDLVTKQQQTDWLLASGMWAEGCIFSVSLASKNLPYSIKCFFSVFPDCWPGMLSDLRTHVSHLVETLSFLVSE